MQQKTSSLIALKI